MQVKRFFAADMRQAMKMASDELGADASIIGTRRVAGGVELTAALDYEVPAAVAPQAKPNPELEAELRKTQARIAQAHAQVASPVLPQSLREPVAAAPLLSTQAPVEAGVNPRELAAMRSELHGLRELIEGQLGSMAWGQMQQRKPQQAELWKRLQRMGFPADICKALLDRVSNVQDARQAWRMLLAHLSHALKTPELDPMEEGGVIALVGPAGMGKTTTLAKMAARYVLQYGAQSVALVSLDSYRIGAQEQLKTLGRILGVSVTHVDPSQSLTQALLPLARKRVVLIDTAGLPAADPALRLQLESLRGVKARSYLVLAATSQAQVLKAAYHSYKRCGLSGCVVSKVDEAVNLGEVLGLAISHQLPVAYLADGPRIPEDLHRPRSHQLVSRAVSLQTEEDPSEQAMADVFAGLYQAPSRQVG